MQPARTLLTLATITASAVAQVQVAVQATNAAGVAIDRANNTRAVQNHAANTPITTYSRAFLYEQNPYAYAASYVSPPVSLPNGPTYNRVTLSVAALARKSSGHKSLHTTDASKGDPGTQRFRVTLSTTQATALQVDWMSYGNIYAASTASLKFTAGATTKSWSYTSGYSRDSGSLQLTLNGKLDIDVEMTGQCQPGAPGGNAYYDGFSAYLYFNVIETGGGSFTTFGTGCAQGKIGATSVPTRGKPFTLTLTGDKPNRPAALLWGYSKDYHHFIKLPLDLSYMGANGCFLNVGFVYPWFRQTDAQGDVQAQVFIPYNASGTLYGQWLLWDPASPSTPPTLTKGAEIKY